MTLPLVSILLPFRNAERTIDRCLESIIGQSLHDWELIAVDDGSTDKSYEIIGSYAQTDSRIKLHSSKGNGIVDALNQGISVSLSHLIARMDADDVMHPQRLMKQCEYLLKNQEVAVLASKVTYLKGRLSGSGKGYEDYVRWSNQVCSASEISLRRFEESPIVHPSVTFRKAVIQQSGNYKKGHFPEDYELWLRLLSRGVVFEKLNQCLLGWFDHEERSSRKESNYSKINFQKIKAEFCLKWLKEKNICNKRKVSIWGAGKIAMSQLKYLVDLGLKIYRIYEVDPKKFGIDTMGNKVLGYDGINKNNNEFILVLSGARVAKLKIFEFLHKRGFKYGENYISLV